MKVLVICRIALLFLLLLISLAAESINQHATLNVNITKLRNNKGHVLISLFKEGAGYPDEPEKAFRKEKLVIKDNKASHVFTGLPAGEYAIAILHDENDDLKMNKTWLGLPKEGYGFSNNVMGTFGPPSYSKAMFSVNTGKTTLQEIRTRY